MNALILIYHRFYGNNSYTGGLYVGPGVYSKTNTKNVLIKQMYKYFIEHFIFYFYVDVSLTFMEAVSKKPCAGNNHQPAPAAMNYYSKPSDGSALRLQQRCGV